MNGFGSNRRQFMAGLLAAGVAPLPTWADAGSPTYLSAAAKSDGTYVLCGINDDLSVGFEIPLPDRGHAATAHPTRPEASSDGALLFTTENDYEVGTGRIGVWDATRGYKRVDDWDSGGIGPHDDSGRTKLNIPTMAPKLAYIENGAVLEEAALPAALHKNSIRHLAVSRDGMVALGMQWQGETQPDSLVGTHRRGEDIILMQAPMDAVRVMEGYIGSVAISADGDLIATTSPRGGQMQIYDVKSQTLKEALQLEDVCGVAQRGAGFTLTAGTGALQSFADSEQAIARTAPLAWDNHLIRI